ncbi:MAG: diphosphate--fructose-6-phosphate 1-phosphotransferase [Planctomycetota bacterium]
MGKNVIVAQSGGPSPVINNSLRGVVETCREFPTDFGRVYGAHHGVEGILKEELIDLSQQDAQEIALLRTTPAAGAIGTCRYKLKESQKEDFDRIIDVMRAHEVGYFFYIGGNDSMDTAHKVSELAHRRGLDLVATGVPKTIDNDVGDSEFKVIDHTPGYGSAARYWAHLIQNAEEENRGACTSDRVLVLQVMGRKIGYLPAATRLGDPKRETPLLIGMVESKIDLERLADLVNDMVRERGRAILAVSEGFSVGALGERRDSFGHVQFSASESTVMQVVVNYLNGKGLPARGTARGQVMGTDQRASAIYASTVDLDEAYRVGRKAVLIARADGTGYMSTILREPESVYAVRYDKVKLEVVANSERTFPQAWIADSRVDVTDDFVRYARPLIGEDWPSVPMVDGRQRFAQLAPIYAEKRCRAYVPQAERK